MEIVHFKTEANSHNYSSTSYWHYIPEKEIVILNYSDITYRTSASYDTSKGIKLLRNNEAMELAHNIAHGHIPNKEGITISDIGIIDADDALISTIIEDIDIIDEKSNQLNDNYSKLYAISFGDRSPDN